jgi:hypothetical protein
MVIAQGLKKFQLPEHIPVVGCSCIPDGEPVEKKENLG